jgi:succinate dehydrogenase / fumarate reductase membrane anchor subunit
MSMRSPLGQARGLGSAKDGTHHFWVQRISAVALIPLALWFVFSVAHLAGGDYFMVRHWVHAPSVAVVLVLFITAALYHSMLGIQVVIEDYIGNEGSKIVSLLHNTFLHAIVAVATIFAVLKVALGT